MLIKIEKKNQSWEFEADHNESLLYAGLRAGIPLPYECATGTCGTCKARVKDGEPRRGWQDAPGRKRLKADRGDILLCQDRAMGHCTVSVPSAIQPFREDDVVPDFHAGVITNRRKLTHDVLSFDLLLDTAAEYHAGQFFVFEAPGIDGFRGYSMVSFGGDPSSLEFVIKRKPHGRFSDWIFQQHGDEDNVRVFGPLGRATFHPDEHNDLFMIAGGSGIAGLLSILTHADQCGHFDRHRADVFFGIRSVADVFHADRLCEISARHPDKVRVTLVYSEEAEGVRSDDPDIGRHLCETVGMVHETALANLAPEAPGKMIYLAGPPPMVDACIRSLVVDIQAPAERIRYDKFG